MSGKATVSIDSDLKLRLSALAEQEGASVSELAEVILRNHADEAERVSAEMAEDEQRWQRYLETGRAVSFDEVRAKLRRLAAQAAAQGER